ncbi:alpha-humulene 10-hydroxylase-like [Musa acuminata AAA Group]|uniref:alpha-humulene 10-hydroxylase-like n=1 Tax=Musa acuminata AAA Group TaxID=214697 RepID=UPI0031D8555C
MSELMRNPETMKRAQEEVREAMRGKGKVEERDAEGLSYLKLVIKETLRLHSPAPLLIPRVGRETSQVLGFKIPAGSRVVVNAWALGRDPTYWGDDAECFRPERFQGSPVDFKGANFEYIPFGAGRRMCPGVQFAMVGVELVLAHLLFYFDWELPHAMKPGDLDMTENMGGTASRKSELFLLAAPRIPLPDVDISWS